MESRGRHAGAVAVDLLGAGLPHGAEEDAEEDSRRVHAKSVRSSKKKNIKHKHCVCMLDSLLNIDLRPD